MTTENTFILPPGAILDGQYRIERVLGKGGMGVVYLARHTLLDDQVAIKLVLPHLADEQYIQRFLREGKVARLIHHSSIITIYDLRITHDGIIYMVMEYFDGHTLAKELEKRGKFSPKDVVELLEPVVNALQIAHSNGIIHRDLHPSNIMLKETDPGKYQVKLLDLGLAKIQPNTGLQQAHPAQLTMVGQILGTPYYMSPEQWEPKTHQDESLIDFKTDIYSLAVVIYELISGHKPFSGQTIQHLAYQHIAVVPTPLHEIEPSIPKAFSDVIACAMAKNANQRPESIRLMFDQLQASISGVTRKFVEEPIQDPLKKDSAEDTYTKKFVSSSLNSSVLGESTNKYSSSALIGEKKLVFKHLSGSKIGQEEKFLLTKYEEFSFGREPNCTIAYDPYKDDIVARQQAKLIKDHLNSEQFVVVDNNSRNGTFVNNQRVIGSEKVKLGDIIKFGINGPELQIDLEPKPIPSTKIPESLPPTRVSAAFPSTKVATDALNATLTESIIIKHLSGSKANTFDYFPARDIQEITIGRDPLSKIKYDLLKDDLVSTKHAKICPEPGMNMRFIIIDLNSRNGTFVNKQKVINKMAINFGDKIQLGVNGPEFEFNISNSQPAFKER